MERENGSHISGSVLTLLIAFAAGCSGFSTDPYERFIDGTYTVSGIQTNMDVCWLGSHCEPGDVLSSESAPVEFTFMIERISQMRDTVRVWGLHGVNAGERNVRRTDCGVVGGVPNTTSECQGFARLSGKTLEFELGSPGGIFMGTGTLDKGVIQLQTSFYYRGIRIEYELEGHRIKELDKPF